MTRIARWALLPAVLAGWLIAGSLATAAVPEIKDEGKFFNAETVKKANELIRKIHDEDHKDLFIETYATVPGGEAKSKEVKQMTREARDKFFADWNRQREQDTRLDDIYVLICRNPGHIDVGVDKETVKQAFTRE